MQNKFGGATNTPKSLNANEKRSNFSVTNNNSKTLLNQQLCQCGKEILRSDAFLLKAKTCAECKAKEAALVPFVEALVTTPRRVFVCKPCRNCGKAFTRQKLVLDLAICHRCLKSAQTESPAKRSKIISGKVYHGDEDKQRAQVNTATG